MARANIDDVIDFKLKLNNERDFSYVFQNFISF